MHCDIHIKNAHIVDPARNLDRMGDLYISGMRLVEPADPSTVTASETVDARGYLVTPGLIDFHTHLNHFHSDFGVYGDLLALPNGITSAVDAGSCGSSLFEGFYRHVMATSEMTIKAFLNVSATGVATEQFVENLESCHFDRHRVPLLLEQFGHDILGLKVRIGKNFSGALGLKPLEDTLAWAEELHLPVCVHATGLEEPLCHVLDLLRPGDVLCHCFQDLSEHTILDDDGNIVEAAHRARQRGVIFDCATGRINQSLVVAKQAVDQGFWPDIISTDVVRGSAYHWKLNNLLYPLSCYLALGLPLMEVLRRATVTPAQLMGMAGTIGTLAAGARADVAIFKLAERDVTFRDLRGNTLSGSQLLLPQMTIKNGQIVYQQFEFMF